MSVTGTEKAHGEAHEPADGNRRGLVIGTRTLGFGVPRTLARLREYLQGALEVEHLTIPPYLTAMYTIRAGTNRPALQTIRGVVLEEMLHMTLVANLLNAVGGTPRVAHPDFVRNYPAKLPYSALDIEIPLAHFSPETMRTFLAIERPQYLPQGPDTAAGARPPAAGSADGWTSIGQFYDHIRRGLIALTRELGEDAVFTGQPGRQVGPDDFYNSGGEVFAVHDLESALTALRVVTEQGEGIGGGIWDSDDLLFGEQRQAAHYFRFNEILTGRTYGPHDIPGAPPSGPPLDVSWEDAHRIDPTASVAAFAEHDDKTVYRHAVAFNDCYARMLAHLQHAYTGVPRCMSLAVPAMLQLRDLATRLYRNPHPDPALAARRYFASATFEIEPRQLENGLERALADLEAAGLATGRPVDLSPVEPRTAPGTASCTVPGAAPDTTA